MTFYTRICLQCGHRGWMQTHCGRADCDLADRYDLRSMHEHCQEGCRCTYAGCQTEKVPLSSLREDTVMPISAPRTGGDQLPPNTVVGHLLIVKSVELRAGVQTQLYGLVDAVECDVVDLDAVGGPAISRGVLWFNKMLVSGLRRQVGEIVLGWMTTGIAKGKQDPPFQLADATTDAPAMARANAWLIANPSFEHGVSAPAAAQVTPVQSTGGSMPAHLQGSVINNAGSAPAPAGVGVINNTGSAPANGSLADLPPETRRALESLGYDVIGR